MGFQFVVFTLLAIMVALDILLGMSGARNKGMPRSSVIHRVLARSLLAFTTVEILVIEGHRLFTRSPGILAFGFIGKLHLSCAVPFYLFLIFLNWRGNGERNPRHGAYAFLSQIFFGGLVATGIQLVLKMTG